MSFADNSNDNGQAGRARGYSMISGLFGQTSGTGQQNRSGLIDDIANDHTAIERQGSSSSTDTPVDHKSSDDQPHTGQEIARSKPIMVENSVDLADAKLSANMLADGDDYDDYDDGDLSKWATGLPPKKSFLGADGDDMPAVFKVSRRSTLAHKVELDSLLKATMIEYNDHEYLPLTRKTVHCLSPFWKNLKPISDMSIFSCIMINKEVNVIHADHVVAALERIGEHCRHLLVVAPVHTSELGNVFNREEGNISPGNDWDHVLRCFPNLERLAFVHLRNVPLDLSRASLNALVGAVARRQAALDLHEVSFNAPPGVLAPAAYDTSVAAASSPAN